MRRLPGVAAAAGLVAATLVITAPIARHGSPIGHDSRHHFVWAAQFAESLAAGVLYPRWLPDVNAGLGNPTFVFYGPLLYYTAALLRPITGEVPRALDLACGLALLASGVAAYRYLRVGLGRAAALLGAVTMMALPYRLLDLYERAALAEFVAFVWPPLMLLALRGVAASPTWRAAGPAAAALAAATAGLALTHLPSLVVWGPIVALAALAPVGDAATPEIPRAAGAARGWPEPVPRQVIVARAWAALGLGLGLAAVYLLPAAWERRFVQIEWLDWVARAEDHTLFSTRMAHREVMAWFNAKVSRLAVWEAALAAVAAAAALWPGEGRPWRGAPCAPRQGAPLPGSASRLPVAATAAVAAVVFALMTPWSAPLWRSLPVLPAIQFPWRLLVVLTPAAALLVACAAARLAASDAPAASRALGVVTVVLLAANLVVGARDIVLPARLDPQDAARLAGDPAGAQDAAEYRPLGAPATGFPQLPRAAMLVAGGRAEVLAWKPTRRLILVAAPEPGPLRVATFLYPGWRARIDGAPAPLAAGPAGVIEVEVPTGRHLVEVRFGSTPDRRAGLAVSAASALLLLGWAGLGRLAAADRVAAAPTPHRQAR